MINLSMHTDNWRCLSGSFEQACEAAKRFGLEHIEFGVVDGQEFVQGLGFAPTISLDSNPIKLRRYMHVKDVSESLAAAVRGEDTGIATSESPIGQGANAENIRECIRLLKEADWNGVLSVECLGTEENLAASIDWIKEQLEA